MGKKEEFKKLIDETGNAIFAKGAKDPEFEISLTTKNVLKMLINLNEQIEAQNKYLNKLESKLDEQVKRIEINLHSLVRELQNLGYINIKERRKLLKRNIMSLEALINLLKKKGVMKDTELLQEMMKIRSKKT
jgi:hypothetical protein